jgi:translation elongation factor EF-1alpha
MWSESVFIQTVEASKTALQYLGISVEQATFVPASGLGGENLMMPSPHLAWYRTTSTLGTSQQEAGHGMTVVEALDQIFLET